MSGAHGERLRAQEIALCDQGPVAGQTDVGPCRLITFFREVRWQMVRGPGFADSNISAKCNLYKE